MRSTLVPVGAAQVLPVPLADVQSGAVDRHVDPAFTGNDAVDDRLDRVGIADIQGRDTRLTAALLDRRRHPIQFTRSATGQHQTHARVRQCECRRLPDARTCGP
jgi:hypothetical protein